MVTPSVCIRGFGAVSGDGEIQWREFDAWLRGPDTTWATVGMDVGSAAPRGAPRAKPKVPMDSSIPSYAQSAAERSAPQMAQVARAQALGEARAGGEWFRRGGGRVTAQGPSWCVIRDTRKREVQTREEYAQRMGMSPASLGNAGRAMLANAY